MEILWTGQDCILCLRAKGMTVEHLIPGSLGGKLTSSILCKDCNSQLGTQVESQAQLDPTVLQLAAQLRTEIPKLATRLEAAQTYLTIGPGVSSRGKIKNGDFAVHTTRLADGSLIQATSTAAKTLKSLLRREGRTELEITGAMQCFAEAPENTKVTLSPEIDVVKWSVTGLRPSLDGPMLNPLIPVKAAYEFLALHLGTAIYQDTPALVAIRKSLSDGQLNPMHIQVERLHAPEASAFHGLLFEGNTPYAKVQVRLFGQLAFRIHFKRLSVGGPRGMYTLDLSSGEEFTEQFPEIDGPTALSTESS